MARIFTDAQLLEEASQVVRGNSADMLYIACDAGLLKEQEFQTFDSPRYPSESQRWQEVYFMFACFVLLSLGDDNF